MQVVRKERQEKPYVKVDPKEVKVGRLYRLPGSVRDTSNLFMCIQSPDDAVIGPFAPKFMLNLGSCIAEKPSSNKYWILVEDDFELVTYEA
jgi:hypothetical protein